MDVLVGLVALATLGERISEVLIKPILEWLVNGQVPEGARVWIYRVTCAVPGFLIVFAWQQDAFAMLGFIFPGAIGVFLTALVAGLGANFAYEFISLVRVSRGGRGPA